MYIIVVTLLAILLIIAALKFLNTGYVGGPTDTSDWERKVSKHFEGIGFPILIVTPNSEEVLETLEELFKFLNDPDLYYHGSFLGSDLIDSKGYRYVWLFDQDLQAGIPSQKGDPISFEEFKRLVEERFPKLQQFQYTSNESFSTLMRRIISL